jgi:hypothetical protein
VFSVVWKENEILRRVILPRLFVVNNLFARERSLELSSHRHSMFEHMAVLSRVGVVWCVDEDITVLIDDASTFPCGVAASGARKVDPRSRKGVKHLRLRCAEKVSDLCLEPVR